MFYNDTSGCTRSNILGGDFTTQIPHGFNQLCQFPTVGHNPYLTAQMHYGNVNQIPYNFMGQTQTPYTQWNQTPYTQWNQTPYNWMNQSPYQSWTPMWNQNPFHSFTNPFYGTGQCINYGVPTSTTPVVSGVGINHPYTTYNTVPNTTFGFGHFNNPIGHQQMACR